MDMMQPEPLCTVSRDWRTVSTLEMVELFLATFSARASILPNQDVAAEALAYSEYFHADVAVSLVAANDRWSVYLVSFDDFFGARWLAIRTSYATTLDLDTVSCSEAEELDIPGLNVIVGFPVPPRAWTSHSLP